MKVEHLLVEWRGGRQSPSGPGSRLYGGCHRPVCVETVVGPLHHSSVERCGRQQQQEVNSITEKYARFIVILRVVSRRRFPEGCRSDYIPDLTEEYNSLYEAYKMAPNETFYKRWSYHKLLGKLCRTFPPPAVGARFTVFWASRPCGPAGWLVLLLTKVGDVETNPGPTTLNKRVWICDICHKQIHVKKQISIGCNRIEHWVHLIIADICLSQYTDLYLDLPSTQIIQSHNSHIHNPTPPDPGPSPLPTPHLHHTHHRNQNTDTRPTLPLFHR